MHKLSSKASVSVLCAALGLAAVGCGQINSLKATMAFKDANQLYRGQDFRAAVDERHLRFADEHRADAQARSLRNDAAAALLRRMPEVDDVAVLDYIFLTFHLQNGFLAGSSQASQFQ